MTSLNNHSNVPGNASDGQPESLATKSLDTKSLDMKCEMRKNENIFYICSHQMPATKKKSLDINLDPEVRSYFGYGKRQFKHYQQKLQGRTAS